MELIDATFTLMDDYEPELEDVLEFFRLGKLSGITGFWISKKVYQVLKPLLPVDTLLFLDGESKDRLCDFPGIKRFMTHKTEGSEHITLYQMNDIREIRTLKKYQDASAVSIIGMDDFLCFDYKQAFKEIQNSIKGTLYLFPENEYDLAVATAILFAKNGGKHLITTFSGMGNKAATEQVLLSLHLFCKYKTTSSLALLADMKQLIERMTGEELPEKMPVIGNRIFWVESGIHVDGIIKNPSNYELYPPELVGQKRKIVMGKHSGISAVKIKLKEMGYPEFSEETGKLILSGIRQASMEKSRSLYEDEIDSLVRMFL